MILVRLFQIVNGLPLAEEEKASLAYELVDLLFGEELRMRHP